MKKTKKIEGVLLLSIAALAMQGCSSPTYTRRCVDAAGNLIPDSACGGTTTSTMGRGYSYPHWIYTGSRTTYSGNRVTGGYDSSMPDSGTVKSSSGSVISTGSSRGGFGGSGSSGG